MAKRKPESTGTQRYLTLDTETTGLDFYNPDHHFDNPNVFFHHPARPFMVTACDHEGHTWIWEWAVDPYTRHVAVNPQSIEEIRSLTLSYPLLVFHNSLFDILALSMIGLDLTDRWEHIHDTLPMSHILDSGEQHGLKPLAAKYLGILNTDEDILRQAVKEARNEAKARGVPRGPSVSTDYFLPTYFGNHAVRDYAVQDAVRTALLFPLLLRELTKQRLLHFYERERRIIPVTYNMQRQGLRVRPRILPETHAKHAETTQHLRTRLAGIAHKYHHPNFNPNSHPQLASLLHLHPSGFHLPVLYETDGGKPSTDKEAMETYENIAEDIATTRRIRTAWRNMGYTNPTPKFSSIHWKTVAGFYNALVDYRAYNVATSYLTAYLRYAQSTPGDRDQLIHASFNPWGTATTRFSCSDPNAQNVGKSARVPLRHVFGPPKDHVWYSLDYNQLELRLMAKASGDKTLLRILAEGQDRHQLTADALGVSRKQAKNINFAWQYGASDAKLSAMAGMDAEAFNAAMRKAYPGVVAFMENNISLVRQRYHQDGFGYVFTLFGYRLAVSINAPYKSTNYIIQGTAGDLCKMAMIAIDGYLTRQGLHDRIQLILTIHDELVLQAHKSVPIDPYILDIAHMMSRQSDAINCPTPVNVSRATTHWGDCKQLNLSV